MSGADRGKACVPVADMASGSVLCMCSAMSGIDALMTLLSGGDAEARGPLGELSGMRLRVAVPVCAMCLQVLTCGMVLSAHMLATACPVLILRIVGCYALAMRCWILA